MALFDSGPSFLSGIMQQTTTDTNRMTNGTQNTDGNSSGQAMNQYTGQQQGLQGQALGFIQDILAGKSAPSNMGLPQNVWDTAMFNFNKYQAPQWAAQHGAGSPLINSAMQELMLNLSSQSGQMAMDNSIRAFDQAANWAFKPIGTIQNDSQSQTANTFSQMNETVDKTQLDPGSLFSGIANLAGLLPSFRYNGSTSIFGP